MGARPESHDGEILFPLPRVEDLRVVRQGYEREAVHDALATYERQLAALQARIRVLTGSGDARVPGAHPIRMDALHLIQSAAGYAEELERDAYQAAARQLAETRNEIAARAARVREEEITTLRMREETELERAAILRDAREQASAILSEARRAAADRLRTAQSQADRLVEQSRHGATESTQATRLEIDRILSWAHDAARDTIERARRGAEQLLAAAGHDERTVGQTVEAMVLQATENPRGPAEPRGSDDPEPA